MKKILLCASAFALMLGSCSKDDTETAVVEVKGKVAFSAVMNVDAGNETRTHVVDNKYYWDQGDKLTASVKGNSEVIPFVVKNETSGQADFTVVREDLDYLGAGPYYLTYPENTAAVQSSAEDASDAKIAMTIPAKQRYRENSFAATTAPAVAVIKEYDIANPPVVYMEPVSSFLRVPVTGFGDLKSLTLQIKNSEGKYYTLNGAAEVNFYGEDAYNLDFAGANNKAAGDAQTLTVSFGATPKELNYNEPINVWFVIPANLELPGATVIFTPDIDGVEDETAVEIKISDGYSDNGKTYLVRNKCLPVSNPIMVGLENKVVVSDEADFIKYAYAVKTQNSEYQTTDGSYKTAVVVNDLDFSTFDANAAAQLSKDDVLMVEALSAYQNNENKLSSIAEGANIEGVSEDITISNMHVDARIFGSGTITVKNITFDSVVADADAGVSYFGWRPICSNVKVVNPQLNVSSDNKTTPAMFSVIPSTILANAGGDNLEVDFEAGNVKYIARELAVSRDLDASDEAYSDYFGAVLRFETITSDASCPVIYGLEVGTPVENVLAALEVDNEGALVNPISVLSGEGAEAISYWTGAAVEADDDDYLTAEELAGAVSNMNSNDTKTVVLKNNIDLRGNNGEGLVWTVGGGAVDVSAALDKDQKPLPVTVSNAYIAGKTELIPSVNIATYSLFGNVVNAKDITVKDVTIKVAKLAEGASAIVGGLGYQGSANNVTVEGLSISIDKDVVMAKDFSEVAGLISAPTATFGHENNSENNTVSGLAINTNGNESVGANGGLFAVAPEKFNGNEVAFADGAAAMPMIGQWTVTDDHKGDNAITGLVNEEGNLIGNLILSASASGQTIILEFDETCKAYNGYYIGAFFKATDDGKTNTVIVNKGTPIVVNNVFGK